MRESALETLLVNLVRRAGGIAVKLMPTVAGIPDRLVLWPGGRAELVELKTVPGRLAPAQTLWHARAAAIGHPVTVLRGPDEIRKWVEIMAVPSPFGRSSASPSVGHCGGA